MYALTIGEKYDATALNQLVAGRGRVVNMPVVKPESELLISAAKSVVEV